MKNVFTLFFAGILGGLMVLGGTHFFKAEPSTQMVNSKVTPVSNSEIVVPNINVSFVEAAAKSTPAVVHIQAEESETLAQQRMQENRNKRQENGFEFFSLEELFGGSKGGFGQFFRQKGSGSGVLISDDGYIVTNNHVVEFADNIIVTLSNKKEYFAKKIGTDPSTDLAVIKIEGENFPTVEFADSEEVRVGEWVLAVGNPFDYLTSTVTAGIVSAIGRDINIIKEDKAIEEFIQTDAAINPGNSGGALVNTNGDLIGINTAIATPTGTYAGYSFAIPSNLAKDIIQDIIENGDIERASLGVAGYDLDEELVETYKIKTNEGFYVMEVISGSAAEFGGILPGDVITELDGTKVKGFDDLSESLKFGKVGDEMVVTVNRDGKTKMMRVRLRKSL
jgi:Do/DeqQ family serine protease